MKINLVVLWSNVYLDDRKCIVRKGMNNHPFYNVNYINDARLDVWNVVQFIHLKMQTRALDMNTTACIDSFTV